MVHLAELNENSICIGVKTVKYFIDDGRHVEIESPDFDYYLWRKYENDQWSEQKFEPVSTAPIDEFEQLKQRATALENENLELKLALAEMAEAQEADKTEVQLALAELAELIAGGE
jgi:hypothetical protein